MVKRANNHSELLREDIIKIKDDISKISEYYKKVGNVFDYTDIISLFFSEIEYAASVMQIPKTVKFIEDELGIKLSYPAFRASYYRRKRRLERERKKQKKQQEKMEVEENKSENLVNIDNNQYDDAIAKENESSEPEWFSKLSIELKPAVKKIIIDNGITEEIFVENFKSFANDNLVLFRSIRRYLDEKERKENFQKLNH